jgi:hypothetical protein
MAGVNLTAMWRGRRQHCRFVHSVASLITFLPHLVCSALTVLWNKDEMKICWIQSNWHWNWNIPSWFVIQESLWCLWCVSSKRAVKLTVLYICIFDINVVLCCFNWFVFKRLSDKMTKVTFWFLLSSSSAPQRWSRLWPLSVLLTCHLSIPTCWDLRFAQCWHWGLWSSGMLHCVTGNLTYPGISKECSPFVFKGW